MRGSFDGLAYAVNFDDVCSDRNDHANSIPLSRRKVNITGPPAYKAVGSLRGERNRTGIDLHDSDFYWKTLNGMRMLIATNLQSAGFVNGFSTRLGGVSPYPRNDLNLGGYGEDTDENIEENRRRFLEFFGNGYRITTAWQVHGKEIKPVRDLDSAGRTTERFDALVSDLPNLLSGVKTADCVPVLIGDQRTRAFGAVHSGWRGTLEKISERTVAKMTTEFGSRPEDLLCAIGPAACGKSYEVGPEVVEGFLKSIPAADDLLEKTSGGHALIDLHLANRMQLINAGVRAENISVAPYCTMERTDLFFSYRIEKKLYGKTGRLMSVIGNAPEG